MRRGERGLLYITVAGMELSWLYILLSLLAGLSGARLPLYLLFLLYAISFWVNRFLSPFKLRKRNIVTLNLLLAIISAQILLGVTLSSGLGLSGWLLAVPRALAQVGGRIGPELVVFTGGVLLWWLGCRLSRLDIDFALSIAEFQFGVGFMLFLLFIVSQLDVEISSVVPALVFFFSFALFGVSVAHAASGVSWLMSRMRGYWTGLLILTIIVVIALSLIIASQITPNFLRALLTPVRWLLSTIDRIGVAIADFLIRHMRFPELPPDFVAEPTPPSGGEPDTWEIFSIPVKLRDILRFFIGAFWLLFIVLGIWQFSRWFVGMLRKRFALISGAEVEHLNGALTADILGIIKRFLFRLRHFKLFFLRKRKLTGISEIDSVRGIYRELLSWARKKGLARLYFQTPFEYLYTLSGALPDAYGELRLITERYMSSRYGALLPTEGDLNQLKVSWQKVKKMPLKKKSDHLPEAFNNKEMDRKQEI